MKHTVLQFSCTVVLWSCMEVIAIPLFTQYPQLVSVIPYLSLAQLPTPVERCTNLERALQHNSIFIKRDDMTGPGDLYGGNKVRKLEFLLADAQRRGAREIITYGCVGSNHAVATACYAHQVGLACTLLLKPQPKTALVRQNLLLDLYFKAQIQLFPDNTTRDLARDAMLRAGQDVYFIPTGGSVPLGVLGYVNAVYELCEQIERGCMPEPDVIYVPAGSCGTVAGLALGIALTGMHTRIVAVAVEPEEYVDAFTITTRTLFEQTNQLLHTAASCVPLVQFPEQQLLVNKSFCGVEYGRWNNEDDAATALIFASEKIVTEGTYSAKSVAALIADCANGRLEKDEVVLLWHTYCGTDFSEIVRDVDYAHLESGLQRYCQCD